MAHRPDFGQAHRRVAGRRFPFWCDVDHFAQVGRRDACACNGIGSPVERSPTDTNRLPSFGSMAMRAPAWLTALLVKGWV